jgi:glutathione S-transferase
MTIKLVGAPTGMTKHAAMVLKEKNVPFEFVDMTAVDDPSKRVGPTGYVDLKSFAPLKSEEYKEKQPFGQVPYIVSIY